MGKTDLLCLRIPLKHGKIIDIAKPKRVFFQQIQLLPKLSADLTRIEGRPLLPVRDKEDGIACGKSRQFTQFSFFLLRDKLVDRPFVTQILRHLQIAETAHAHIRGKLEQLFVESFRHLRVHFNGADGSALERFEGTCLEKVCQVNDAKRVSQIRLIRAEL